MYFIQHCFIFRPSDSTVLEDARRLDLIHTLLDLIHTWLDLIHNSARSHPHSARSHPLYIYLADKFNTLSLADSGRRHRDWWFLGIKQLNIRVSQTKSASSILFVSHPVLLTKEISLSPLPLLHWWSHLYYRDSLPPSPTPFLAYYNLSSLKEQATEWNFS